MTIGLGPSPSQALGSADEVLALTRESQTSPGPARRESLSHHYSARATPLPFGQNAHRTF
ncbi:MAG: hypothetical protein PHI28_08575 [Mangrovibacterium sp.]|nr:hypothetical protein [Mangrovibacterium sp.]